LAHGNGFSSVEISGFRGLGFTGRHTQRLEAEIPAGFPMVSPAVQGDRAVLEGLRIQLPIGHRNTPKKQKSSRWIRRFQQPADVKQMPLYNDIRK